MSYSLYQTAEFVKFPNHMISRFSESQNFVNIYTQNLREIL